MLMGQKKCPKKHNKKAHGSKVATMPKNKDLWINQGPKKLNNLMAANVIDISEDEDEVMT